MVRRIFSTHLNALKYRISMQRNKKFSVTFLLRTHLIMPGFPLEVWLVY